MELKFAAMPREKFKNPLRHILPRPAKWHVSSRLLAAELAVVLVAWLTYILFGPALVLYRYNKSLDNPIQTVADDPWSVAFYFEHVDKKVLSLLAIGLLVIAAQMILVRFWRISRDTVRTEPSTSRPRYTTGYSRYVAIGMLYLLLGCVLSLGILTASNRLFVHHISLWKTPNRSYYSPSFPALSKRQVMNLGWVHDPAWAPLSSYLYHSMEKPSGTYRIGVFGDSNTEGQETAPGHDYASFLQEQLTANGKDTFEVINFGVRGYGMQQSFLLYEYLGNRYDLDMAIIMPFDFFYDRDNSFILHVDNKAIHARYVLEGSGLRLVTIDEKTHLEALHRYYSLLPPEKYWIYDARGVNLLTTFPYWITSPRSNPFYYAGWKGYPSELNRLYSMMFAEVARGVERVLVVGNDRLIDSLNNGGHERVMLRKSRIDFDPFLLHAPENHASALGNQMRAAEISEWITGHANRLRLPEVSASEYRSSGEDEITAKLSLTRVSDGWIEIEGHPVAGFFMRGANDPPWRFSKKVNFAQQGILGIIQLDGRESFQQPRFVPVDFPVEDGALVELRLSSSGDETRITIGTLECVASVLCRAHFDDASDIHQLRFERDGRHYKFYAYYTLQALIQNGYFDAMEVLAAGQPILRGRRQNHLVDRARKVLFGRSPDMFVNKFELKPLIADFIFLRAEAGQYVDPTSIPRHGSIQTRLRLQDGSVLRLGSFLEYVLS